ncbi:tripartite motif-containing protein 2-like [Anneissia japonica]|uniref:tripartite motif-containing protein 2-like n=1 Tax=Anneissia japonica TaxID=1529436 RepID=UPI001425A4E6|nr:tripartite motif-containing protein 2-like [Anneissia japonica]
MATSELNQFLEDIDEKVLECAICLKRLQNPKSLNCLHSFCLACLEDWVKKKGKLTCPTCTKSFPIPEGGLQKIPPNTFLNNLLETHQRYDKPAGDHITKCVCGKAEEYYCQDCRHYLCSSCRDYHKMLPISANHKLHAVEDVRSMTPQDFALLNPPLCSLHSKPFELYCQDCKTPICIHCTFINHKMWEGKHKTISISDAFQTFKETSSTLEKSAQCCKDKLEEGLEAVIQTSTKLDESRKTSLQDIDRLVQEMIKTIMNKGDEMKKNVDIIYKQKKQVNDVQMDELKTIISEVNTKLSFLKQLLKSDEATAMQSSETVIKALEDRVNEMPKTEPNDNGQILFFANKHHIASLQQCEIGNVTQSTIDGLTLKGVESVTQGQEILAKIIKADRCNVLANQLKATWTHPTGEINISQVDEDDYVDYVVTGKCNSPGVCRLDVSVDGKPIKQSPMIIKVEPEGLFNTIKLFKNKNDDCRSLVKCEECLLVSCRTNELFKYMQSGEYIGKVTLPQDVKIFKMCKMKNGNIAVSDEGNGCITIVKMNGEVIKSIGQKILKDPAGIHVDEASNTVYAADCKYKCVYIFDIDSGQLIRKLASPNNKIGVIDVTLTNQGNILALERKSNSCDNGLLQFDNEGRLMKVLVKGNEHEAWSFEEVVVDEDHNIILASYGKIQLFSSDGNFIKRIDKPADRIKYPNGLCLISQHPRRIAVINNDAINLYNY